MIFPCLIRDADTHLYNMQLITSIRARRTRGEKTRSAKKGTVRLNCRRFLVRAILAYRDRSARGELRVQRQLRPLQRRLPDAATGGHVTGFRHVRREYDADAEEPGDRVPLLVRRSEDISRERAFGSLLHAARSRARAREEAGF